MQTTAEQATSPESRYSLVEHEGTRVIVCEGSPNIRIRVEAGLTISEDDRKKYPRQTIFLDGILSAPPFLDNELRHYSFDHHTGACPRSFLLSTCEQAAVMVLEGMPLDEGDWQVLLNDPDLDAVLAAWLIANHAPLKLNQGKVLYDVMPLVRVEGVIDAHGTDMPVFSGLPMQLWERYRREIDELRDRERQLKANDQWASTDLVAYTQHLLERLDGRLFPAGDRAQLKEIKEAGRATLEGGKLAIFCRSTQGIYAVEERLKDRFSTQLGLIVLETGKGRFTVRQVDPFLPMTLTDLYTELNGKDPQSDKESSWGGSGDIGGSPRKEGSGLSGEEILAVVRAVYGPRKNWFKRMVGRARKAMSS